MQLQSLDIQKKFNVSDSRSVLGIQELLHKQKASQTERIFIERETQELALLHN